MSIAGCLTNTWQTRYCVDICPLRDSQDSDYMLVPKESVKALLEPCADATILSYTEWREKASEMQLFTVFFYMSYIELELQGGISLILEECDGRLELMKGKGEAAKNYALKYHANGEKRRTSLKQKKVPCIASPILIRDLLEWIEAAAPHDSVETLGFTRGLCEFLASGCRRRQRLGSLHDFLGENKAASLEKPGDSFSSQEGLIKEHMEIQLVVVFSSSDFLSKPRWTVSVDPWKKVSELQQCAEEVLGQPLLALLSCTGQKLEPTSTIAESGLKDGDAVTAEFRSEAESANVDGDKTGGYPKS